MKHLYLVVPGRPVPKARPRVNRKTGGVWTTSQEAELALAWEFAKRRVRFGNAPVEAWLTFLRKRQADVDNLAKLVLDAAQKAHTIQNDSQVVALHSKRVAVKTDAEECTVIEIREAI